MYVYIKYIHIFNIYYICICKSSVIMGKVLNFPEAQSHLYTEMGTASTSPREVLGRLNDARAP